MKKKVLIFLIMLTMFSFAGVKRAYKKALESNTISVFEKFIKEHPNNEFTKDANLRLDTLYYDKAKKDNNIVSYNEYLSKFQSGFFVKEALIEIEKLDYYKSTQKNTINSFNKYLQKYPNGKYTTDAKEKIEDIVFVQCKQKNDHNSFNLYTQKYPNGKYLKEIEKIEFKNCQKINEINQYLSFLKHFPQSKYSAVTKVLLEKKLMKDIISNNINFQQLDSLKQHLPIGKYLEDAFLLLNIPSNERDSLLNNNKYSNGEFKSWHSKFNYSTYYGPRFKYFFDESDITYLVQNNLFSSLYYINDSIAIETLREKTRNEYKRTYNSFFQKARFSSSYLIQLNELLTFKDLRASEILIPYISVSNITGYYTDVQGILDSTAIPQLLKTGNYKAIGDIGHHSAINGLINIIDEKGNCTPAAIALSKIKVKGHAHKLYKYINSTNHDIRTASIYALYRSGDEKALSPYINLIISSKGYYPTYFNNIGQTSESFYLDTIMLDTLIHLRNNNQGQGFEIIRAIGRINTPKSMNFLIKELAKCNTYSYEVAKQLGNFKHPQAVKALIENINKDCSRKYESIQSLCKIADSNTEKYLQQLYSHQQRTYLGDRSDVHTPLATALCKIWKEKNAINLLLKATTHKYPEMRCASMKYLGQIGDKKYLNYIIPNLTNSNRVVRLSAIEAIQKMCIKIPHNAFMNYLIATEDYALINYYWDDIKPRLLKMLNVKNTRYHAVSALLIINKDETNKHIINYLHKTNDYTIAQACIDSQLHDEAMKWAKKRNVKILKRNTVKTRSGLLYK